MLQSGRARIILTSAIVFLLIAAVALMLAITSKKQEEAPTIRKATEEEKRNILLNQEDRKRMIRDFNARMGRSGKSRMKEGLKLKYKISPELQKQLDALQPRKRSFAGAVYAAPAGLCNIGEIPDAVYVQDLRGHLILEESRVLALEYGVDSISYSLDTELSPTTFQYLFILPDNTASFSQYESSGVYLYNKTSMLPVGQIAGDGLRRYANQILADHKLDLNLSTPQYRTIGDHTDFIYRKNLPDFMLVDEASIQTLMDSSNCSVTESDIMGLITVSVKNNGEVLKVLNNTRMITNTYKMSTVSLQQALIDYGESQPIDPIVFPSDAEVDDTKPVLQQAAILAYFDVGVNFAQSLYVPLYITLGFGRSTDGRDIQILGFFPAVSADELAQKGLIHVVPEPGDASTQQQGTFGFASPTPHQPPPYSAPKPEFGVSGPGCPGNLVDYMVSCSDERTVICRGNFTSSAANDPIKACVSGCMAKVAAVSVAGGTNPCDAIMQQNGITSDKINGEVPRQRLAPAGEVSCVITVCPS